MSLRRILQLSLVALLFLPGVAFADTFNLAGGTWTESGDSFTLTTGPTTLQTGAINSFFFFFGSSGDTGSVSTNSFSCTDCVTTNESLTFTGFFTPTIALSGDIAAGATTGSYWADLIGSNILSGSGGTIEAGAISLSIPATDPSTPTPEPSTWVLLLAGLGMLGTAAFSRKMGWISQPAEKSGQV